MFSWDLGDFSKGHTSFLTSVMRGNTDLGHGQDMYCWWAGVMAVHMVKALKLSVKPTHPKISSRFTTRMQKFLLFRGWKGFFLVLLEYCDDTE